MLLTALAKKILSRKTIGTVIAAKKDVLNKAFENVESVNKLA